MHYIAMNMPDCNTLIYNDFKKKKRNLLPNNCGIDKALASRPRLLSFLLWHNKMLPEEKFLPVGLVIQYEDSFQFPLHHLFGVN
jgi:hypothetical protein